MALFYHRIVDNGIVDNCIFNHRAFKVRLLDIELSVDALHQCAVNQ